MKQLDPAHHAFGRAVTMALLHLAFATSLVLSLLALPRAAFAAERDPALEVKIRDLVREGRCAEALPDIERARGMNSDSGTLALLEGQCRLRVFDYVGAQSSLGDARRLDSGLLDVEVYLAIALYHLEDFSAADQAIARAEGFVSAEAEPQYELYRGLLLLHHAEPRQAALALERARVADASQVEPVASYYAGLAWQSINEREMAREAFERVRDVDGNGAWGRRANAALESTGLEERNWATLRVGMEYDSNVVLAGEDIKAASGQSDGRGVWFLEGGAELFRIGRFSGGVLADYAGSAHFNLRQYDTHYPTGSLWLDRTIGNRSLVRLRYGAGYAWVDYDPFVTSQVARLSFHHNWGDPGNSEAYLGWEWNNYHFPIAQVPQAAAGKVPGDTCPDSSGPPCAPNGVDSRAARDRDGNGLNLGFVHRHDVRALESDTIPSVIVFGGYGFRSYWAEGTDWDYSSHELEVGIETEIFWQLGFDFSTSYAYQPFDNPSSYPEPPTVMSEQYALSTEDRLDKVWQVSALVDRPITDWAKLSASYIYTRNISNVSVFDYSRHVVGGYLTFSF